MCDRRYTPERITHLKENEIFVFGSNLAGSHGGGAARQAYNSFGTVWDQGVGLQGQSYAIPTMHGGVEAIRPYVDQFVAFAPLFGIDNVIFPKEFVEIIGSGLHF